MKPSPNLSLPNWLSYFRLILGFAIPALLVWSTRQGPLEKSGILGLAFVLFVLGAFTDFWDGWIARRRHLETPLGRFLDPMADKVFILGTMAAFAFKGVYSYWYLVPIFMREISVTFCRSVWLHQGRAIGAERAGKLKLGLQVTSVVFSFAYLSVPTLWMFYLNHLILIVTVIMTLYSGYSFLQHNRMFLRDRWFAQSVASLGVGHLRPFPGTYGTLLGMAILPAVSYDPLLHFIILLSFIGLGYFAILRMQLKPEEDPLEVIIDEVCGILLAFWFIPLSWQSLLVGFFAFRFFDVTKIFPIGWLERRHGTHGILWDDLGAGAYTWLVLKILFR